MIEIGTSHGVSTLYLAAALRDQIDASGGTGIVTGTKYEPEKGRIARGHFATARLGHLIDPGEGDPQNTLHDIEGPVDFVLADIWIRMARPALEPVVPHLRSGAIVVYRNNEQSRGGYADYFAFIDDPANCFRTMRPPFTGGLELPVRC